MNLDRYPLLSAQPAPLFKLDQFKNSVDNQGQHKVLSMEDLQEGFKRVKQNVFAPHRHDYYEFFVVQSGEAILVADGQEHCIKGPSTYVIPPGTVHAWEHDPDLNGLIMRVPSSAFYHSGLRHSDASKLALQQSIHRIVEAPVERIINLASWMFDDLVSGLPGGEDMLADQLKLVLDEVFRQGEACSSPAARERDSQLCAQYCLLVENHYSQPWFTADYAARLGVSTCQLARALGKQLSTTPAQHLQHYRLLEAKRLVLYGEYSLSQISDAVGYPSQSYFCRVFQKTIGMTASEFRRKGRSH